MSDTHLRNVGNIIKQLTMGRILKVGSFIECTKDLYIESYDEDTHTYKIRAGAHNLFLYVPAELFGMFRSSRREPPHDTRFTTKGEIYHIKYEGRNGKVVLHNDYQTTGLYDIIDADTKERLGTEFYGVMSFFSNVKECRRLENMTYTSSYLDGTLLRIIGYPKTEEIDLIDAYKYNQEAKLLVSINLQIPENREQLVIVSPFIYH